MKRRYFNLRGLIAIVMDEEVDAEVASAKLVDAVTEAIKAVGAEIVVDVRCDRQ